MDVVAGRRLKGTSIGRDGRTLLEDDSDWTLLEVDPYNNVIVIVAVVVARQC